MYEKAQVWIYSREAIGGSLSGARKLLLLKTTPARGSIWQPVTGKVEGGERITIAALREAEEETGFAFTAQPTSLDYSFEFEGRFGKAREQVYALEAPAGCPAPRLDPREHVGFEWLGVEEARRRLGYPSFHEGLNRLVKHWETSK